MKSLFFETVKSKVIITLFETVTLSVSISPKNLYNPMKSIKKKTINMASVWEGGVDQQKENNYKKVKVS